MHATLHQLLILRDRNVPDSAVAAHVQECVECRAELNRLQAVTAGLRNLPPCGPPPDRWPAIQEALLRQHIERAPKREPWRPGWLLPAASAAALVVVVLVTLSMQDNRDRVTTASGQTTAASQSQDAPAAAEQTVAQETTTDEAPVVGANHESLIAESQRLEKLLTVLPGEPRVTRAATALTVAELEDRIRWVDYRMNIGAESGLKPQQSQSLWQERVDLLNSLVAVRYAESNALAF